MPGDRMGAAKGVVKEAATSGKPSEVPERGVSRNAG